MNIANKILELLGLPTGWSKDTGPVAPRIVRNDKINATLAGVPQHLRRHAKRLTHVLTTTVTDKNLRILANKRRAAA